MELSLIEKATMLAVEGHKGQKRLHGAPYVVHPFIVAVKLLKYDFEDHVVAAALVHDLLEDTSITESRIKTELGDSVVNIVKGLTENKELPWRERKLAYIELVRKGSDDVKAVSLGDKVHNMENMFVAYGLIGAEIWDRFGRGKSERIWFEMKMIEMFEDVKWRHPLLDEYRDLVGKFERLV